MLQPMKNGLLFIVFLLSVYIACTDMFSFFQTRNPIVVELYREDETGVKALAYQELLDKGYFVKKS